MTPRQLILETARRFREQGIPDPENDSALLLSSLTGRPPLELRLDMDQDLDVCLLGQYEALARKRLERIPLQYLMGSVPFCGHSFLVDSRVLIPRPETELLCAWALEVMQPWEKPRVEDVCCGSGCIGLSLKAARKDADVTLSDLSGEALTVAGENAARLGLPVRLIQRDLLQGVVPASRNLIVSNPPYIPSAVCPVLQEEVRHEPLMALDGGEDGLAIYRRLIPESREVLLPGGALMMELGAGEAEAVWRLLERSVFIDLQLRQDYAGIERMILAFKP